jgi:glutamate synthase (NADPH/NADH) small chain
MPSPAAGETMLVSSEEVQPGMGHETGFLDFPRVAVGHRPVPERLRDWGEFVVLQTEQVLREQASRCMDCALPYCHGFGCPVDSLIPEWNDLVYRGEWREAWALLESTNNMPEVTGRVCPAPCEPACTLSLNSSPVTINQLELAIMEKAFASGWVAPQPPRRLTGSRVAVVGSGPAGLCAAQQLRRAGHEVTVFERSPKPGGLLRFGIPDFKLEKSVVDRRLAQLEAEGVRFETCVDVGVDLGAAELRRSYDAVLLALGAAEPRDLPVPGRELEGVHFAMDFLTLANHFVSGEATEEELIPARGRSVLVIGGGDTGSDCVGTSNRLGAKEVLQVEILPQPPQAPDDRNPSWPRWPSILRTSSSHEEGCRREWGIATKGLRGSDGRVAEAELVRVEWQQDSGGALRPREVPGSEFTVRTDLVLLAMGFLHVRHTPLLEELGVECDERGNVRCGPSGSTSCPGVYAAGDASSGASLVVSAIANGRQVAASIDEYLRL